MARLKLGRSTVYELIRYAAPGLSHHRAELDTFPFLRCVTSSPTGLRRRRLMARQRKRNPNGAGTITKRKDGRFHAAVCSSSRTAPVPASSPTARLGRVRRQAPRPPRQGRPEAISMPHPVGQACGVPEGVVSTTSSSRAGSGARTQYEAHVRLLSRAAARIQETGVTGRRRCPALPRHSWRRGPPRLLSKESHRVLRTALSAACNEELITRERRQVWWSRRGRRAGS